MPHKCKTIFKPVALPPKYFNPVKRYLTGRLLQVIPLTSSGRSYAHNVV